MRNRNVSLTLVLVLALGSLFCWNVYSAEQKQTATVWEYTIVSFSSDSPSQLSSLGAKGWELVSVRKEEQLLGNFRQTTVYYYLKRAQQTRN